MVLEGEVGSAMPDMKVGLFSLLTLVRRAESTDSGPPDLLFSKLENQFLCLLMASLALIFLSGLSGGSLLGLLWLLRHSAVLDTELDLLSRSCGLDDLDLTVMLCLEERPDSESVLEPGL